MLARNKDGGSTNLSFAVRPKVHGKTNHLVDGSIRPLVDKSSGESGEREESQAGLETSVDAASSEEAKGPLPCDEDEPEDQVNGL